MINCAMIYLYEIRVDIKKNVDIKMDIKTPLKPS